MSEWHLPPDYIVNNWTDELFDLMTEKLVERKTRETSRPSEHTSGRNMVSDRSLFLKAGHLIKVEKRDNVN